MENSCPGVSLDVFTPLAVRTVRRHHRRPGVHMSPYFASCPTLRYHLLLSLSRPVIDEARVVPEAFVSGAVGFPRGTDDGYGRRRLCEFPFYRERLCGNFPCTPSSGSCSW